MAPDRGRGEEVRTVHRFPTPYFALGNVPIPGAADTSVASVDGEGEPPFSPSCAESRETSAIAIDQDDFYIAATSAPPAVTHQGTRSEPGSTYGQIAGHGSRTSPPPPRPHTTGALRRLRSVRWLWPDDPDRYC